jgi:hypothetical protein
MDWRNFVGYIAWHNVCVGVLMNNEPVAYGRYIENAKMWLVVELDSDMPEGYIPLYTHPVKEQLTDEEVEYQKNKYFPFQLKNHVLTDKEISDEHQFGDNNGSIEFARAIESMVLNRLKAKELTDEEWNKAFDFYCETDEGVLKFDLELRDEWKKEQLIRWKEALRKAQEK